MVGLFSRTSVASVPPETSAPPETRIAVSATSSSSAQHKITSPTPPHTLPQHIMHISSSSNTSKSSQSSKLLTIIGIAILCVLCFHWYLILHHVNYHAPNSVHYNPFLASSLIGKKLRNGMKRLRNRVIRRRGQINEDGYILGEHCGGCYRTYSKPSTKEQTPCYDVIHDYMFKHNTTLYIASKEIATSIKECAVCNPTTCYPKHSITGTNEEQQHTYRTKYWKFDQTLPSDILQNPTSIVLDSIPDELRIPTSEYDNIESYIKDKYKHPDPANITNVFLLEYNPSIAVIPTYMRTYLPSNARYILSLRVTPHNFCFPIWLTNKLSDDIKQTMHSLNHLGLALLDEQLQIIQGYNVVIDLDQQLGAKREHVMTEPAFVDFRLFNLHDELYLHINSDTVILTKIELRSKSIATEMGVYDEHDNTGTLNEFEKDEKSFKLNNLYGGDDFEVTLLHQFNTIWGTGRDAVYGKNYALFTLPPDTSNPEQQDKAIYAEMSIYPTHTIQSIIPSNYTKIPISKTDHRIKWRQRRNFKIDHIIQRQMSSVGNMTTSDLTYDPIVPSFFNADEVWFPGGKNPFKEFAHGGACCVNFIFDDMDEDVNEHDTVKALKAKGVNSLMVGVGHTLVKVSESSGV